MVGTRFNIEAWVKSLKLFYADLMVVVGGLELLLFLVPTAVAVLLSPTTMTLQFPQTTTAQSALESCSSRSQLEPDHCYAILETLTDAVLPFLLVTFSSDPS